MTLGRMTTPIFPSDDAPSMASNLRIVYLLMNSEFHGETKAYHKVGVLIFHLSRSIFFYSTRNYKHDVCTISCGYTKQRPPDKLHMQMLMRV
jgi:hypothetical protein